MWNVVIEYDPVRDVYRPVIKRMGDNGMLEAEYSGMVFKTRIEAFIEGEIMIKQRKE